MITALQIYAPGIEDIIPYFAVKEIGRHLPRTKIEYWIEDSFAILLARHVWIEIMRAFSEANRLDIPPLDEGILTELDRRKEKYISRLLIGVEITKPEHIDYYMKPKNIILLINSTDIIF